MPTYEYECRACGNEFEMFQKMTDEPLRKCPKCGKLKLKKKVGIGAGIIFKGSGFYCTDYRSPTYRESQKKDSSSASAPASSSEKSSSSSDKTSSESKTSKSEHKADKTKKD